MTPKVIGSYSIRSVHNALIVFEAQSDAEDDIRIFRLSEKLGTNKTRVFRLMATFEARGDVEREKSTGKYRLVLAAGEKGQKIRADLNPRLLDAGDTLSSRLGHPGFRAGYPAP